MLYEVSDMKPLPTFNEIVDAVGRHIRVDYQFNVYTGHAELRSYIKEMSDCCGNCLFVQVDMDNERFTCSFYSFDFFEMSNGLILVQKTTARDPIFYGGHVVTRIEMRPQFWKG